MISDEIIKVLDELAKKFGIVIDWTSQNVIPYLEDLGMRLVKFDTMQHIFGIVICVITLILTLIIFKKGINFFKAESQKEYSDSELSQIIYTLFMIIFGFASVVAIVFAFSDINSIIQNIYLPEKTIYEFIKLQMM